MTARLTAALRFACLGLVLGGGAAADASALTGPPARRTRSRSRCRARQDRRARRRGGGAAAGGRRRRGSFAYPADGSVVNAGSSPTRLPRTPADGTARRPAEIQTLSIFGGDVTVSGVRAAVSSAATIGDLSDSAITNLVVIGTAVSEPTPEPGGRRSATGAA